MPNAFLQIVSLKDRGKYQGVNEIVIAISNGVGPFLGGALAQQAGWRWCFVSSMPIIALPFRQRLISLQWINLPISAVAIVLIWFFLPLKPVEGSVRNKLLQIDYVGALLTIVGAGMVIFPLNVGGTSFAWKSAPVLGCLLGGVALFGVFFLWELKFARIPIVPSTTQPSLIRSRWSG